MLKFLLSLFAPGVQLPPEDAQVTFSYEGISWGWAFFAFVLLCLLVGWSYRRFAPTLGHFTRGCLVVLRCLLLGLILVLLVKPILLVTVEEGIHRPLLVLLDQTQSMGLVDHRIGDDLVRGAIAKGVADPAGGLKQSVPSGQTEDVQAISRQKLLEVLAANEKLKLWSRLYDRADLHFFGFGRKLTDLGKMKPSNGSILTPADAAAFFSRLHYDENLTGLGDGLRDMLDQERGQAISGILVITDGANNTGSPPDAAAALAQQDGVPLFIYGIGVTSPKDIMVSELTGPPVTNVKEKVSMTVHIRAQSLIGKKGTVQLKADGKVVDEEPLDIRADGDQEVTLGYTPDHLGEVALEAFAPPLAEEVDKDNNTAKARIRVVDDKIRVLYVEQLPRWDYQYLVAMMQRDRRIKLKVVLLRGDPGMESGPDSPFLASIPSDKETLYANDIVIIGDVDSRELGNDRMKLLADWVNKVGGGMIFLAGENFNPSTYKGTPLEPLFPIDIASRNSQRYDDNPVVLKLSPLGETSSLLNLADNPQENLKIWENFPGVHWTAGVGKVKPGGQSLLVDPTPSRATPEGPMPVIALQGYGAGQTIFIGTDETYRWRAHAGEKYYTRLWGQFIQSLSSQKMLGASSRTQLHTDRPRYLTGDKVKISGRIFKPNFQPQLDAEVPGTYTIKATPEPGQPPVRDQTNELRLEAVPDRPGEYRGEFTARQAGSYSFSTVQDPTAVLKFDVAEPMIELSDIAMNESLLRSMANAGGGRFFREEDLSKLPDLVSSKAAAAPTYKKIPLAYAPILLVLIIVIACIEWLWRRKLELK